MNQNFTIKNAGDTEIFHFIGNSDNPGRVSLYHNSQYDNGDFICREAVEMDIDTAEYIVSSWLALGYGD